MRVGLLGGTFDPIHTGHLIVAEEARIRMPLERVIFLPAGRPWMKEGQSITHHEHRYRMVELAVSSNPWFSVSRDELDRAGPTYTIDTLQELQEELGQDATLYFIAGLDALEQFRLWKDPEKVLELCHLVPVQRPGHGDSHIPERLFQDYPQAQSRVTTLETPRIEISSTEIRKRASQGVSFRYLTPEPVERYILEHKLYKEG